MAAAWHICDLDDSTTAMRAEAITAQDHRIQAIAAAMAEYVARAAGNQGYGSGSSATREAH